MISLKEWAEKIKEARIVKETKAQKDAAVRTMHALVKAATPEIAQPVVDYIHEAGSVCYSIGRKSFRNLTLSAGDNEDVEVSKSCEACNHLYALKIKAWKIRSCDVAAAPCPRCAAFQTVDLDALRKDRFGAY